MYWDLLSGKNQIMNTCMESNVKICADDILLYVIFPKKTGDLPLTYSRFENFMYSCIVK